MQRAAFREAIQSIFAHLRPLKDDPDSVAVSQVHGLHLDWLIFGTYHAAGDIKGKFKRSRLGKLYSRSRLGRIIGVVDRLWDKFVGVEKLPNRSAQPLPGMTWIKPPPPKRWQQALRGVLGVFVCLRIFSGCLCICRQLLSVQDSAICYSHLPQLAQDRLAH